MTPTTETPPRRTSSARIIVGALILLIGVGWMLEIAGAVDEIPWSYLLPAAVIVVGVGLVADSRGPTHGGLIALGIILTIFLLIDVSVSTFDFTSGDIVIGPRTEHPASVNDLEDYGIFAGELTIDLGDVAFPVGETEVNVNAFAGSVRIIVPDNVTVELAARTFAGEIRALGKQSEGLGPNVDETFTGSDATRILVLDVSTFAGEIEVTR
ncbi:MAG: cell wall-active antibiotics response protein [Acidimicrobiia bacterium]|nr:cell wall-active antibiotics response protein [Acidimicrobiia bacterium]MDH3397168.1 cell wall-active antibiotics response protein [Acidimicrobiia bacterium]MDH5615955.1 cell wall-active antibiotics response protein [Acidimicrobiia bacterium]